MKLHELILTNNDCYKSGRKITPKGVMVHSTGANNPTLKRYVGPDDGLLGQNKYNNHWNMSGISKCVHAFIGKLEDGSIATYQTLPWNHRGWHCGSAGNNTHISFEICEDGLNDADYFSKVYREAVELTAFLCEKYNLDPMVDGVVICHSEGYKRGIASNHGDVMHWFPKHGKSMYTFRKDVKAAMGGLVLGDGAGSAVSTVAPKEDIVAIHYSVRLPMLTKGMRMDAVKAMQQLLIANGYKLPRYGTDGDFGGETEQALRKYQNDKGLAADGKCGPATWSALLGLKGMG